MLRIRGAPSRLRDVVRCSEAGRQEVAPAWPPGTLRTAHARTKRPLSPVGGSVFGGFAAFARCRSRIVLLAQRAGRETNHLGKLQELSDERTCLAPDHADGSRGLRIFEASD